MTLSNLSYQAVKSVSNGVSFHLHRHWHQNCKIVIQDLNLDMADPNHDLTRVHSNYSRCCNSDDSNNCRLSGSLDLATLNWPLVEFDKVQLDLVVVWNDCQVPKYHNKISKIGWFRGDIPLACWNLAVDRLDRDRLVQIQLRLVSQYDCDHDQLVPDMVDFVPHFRLDL